MHNDVVAQVIRRVAEMAGVAPASVTASSAFEDLNIDSLSAVSLVGELEDDFGVSIPNEEVLNIRTVSDAVASLERAIAAGGGA